MSNTNTGGPAFPVHPDVQMDVDLEWCGMTLRDYFAAKALPQIYKDYAECARTTGWDEKWQNGLARDAYALADAMLKAREA